MAPLAPEIGGLVSDWGVDFEGLDVSAGVTEGRVGEEAEAVRPLGDDLLVVPISFELCTPGTGG